MDSQKTIKKYILPKSWIGILGFVLLAAALVLAVLSVGARSSNEMEAVEFYPSESENGTMAYVDVVGISNWLYKYDGATYYSVEDAEGYMYTVRVSDSEYDDMAEQQEYWNRTSETAPMPEAYRLEGYVQSTPSDIRSSLAESWSITTAEYTTYFGTKYLNATTSTGQQAAAPYFGGAMFCGILALLFLILSLSAGSKAKKYLKQLEERCLLEKAAQQLENTETHTVIGKNNGILTQDFLFGKGTGVVVPYSDIAWCYKQDRKRNFVVVDSYLMVGTAHTGVEAAISLGRADKDLVIGQAIAVIAQKNPNALVGYTGENQSAYKALVKAGK